MLADLSRRVTVSKGALPSVCCYTVFNSNALVHSIDISSDASTGIPVVLLCQAWRCPYPCSRQLVCGALLYGSFGWCRAHLPHPCPVLYAPHPAP